MTKRLIDVHAHYVPDHYRKALMAAGHERPDGMPGIPMWSETGMLEMMDRNGIETAILSISSPGIHFGDDGAARTLARTVNQEGARLRETKPRRFGIFASLPLPDIEGSLREIDYAFDTLGADGVVLKTNNAGLYPGDPAFAPVFAELDRRSAVVFFHPTSPHCSCCSIGARALPRPALEFMFETTRAVTDLILTGTLDRCRKLKVIVPHAGATLPVLIDRIAAFSPILPKHENITPAVVVETLGRIYYDLAGAPVPRLLPALQSLVDNSHILYGSDWPFTPEPAVAGLLGQLKAFFGASGISDDIARDNALALFPRLAT